MEDAATAEISRAQLWQWIRHGARLANGRRIDAPFCRAIITEELTKLRRNTPGPERFKDAAALLEQLIAAPAFPPFLTLPAYEMLVNTAG